MTDIAPTETKVTTPNVPDGHVWIGSLSKEKLMRALWKASKPAVVFERLNMVPPEWDTKKAMASCDESGYHDYVLGRCIKMRIPEGCTSVDPRMYDRDASISVGSIVAKLLSGESSSQRNVYRFPTLKERQSM